MKQNPLKILISMLTAGLTYTVIMAGLDYYDGKEFQLSKFIFNAIFFGLIWYFIFKKLFKNKVESTDSRKNIDN
ncbi:hypothetical protein SAMN05444396_105128 [Flavobacterium segetis]|uniref:Uncharacterized protein n=1 Tax=Flavobacterium segetis TaxID=271157 RepID=A0A1M5HIW6_9FLAO|nr:hypothetical protein [Flavobacterium segetis]SHG15906.1 hypothetical protein SAMN05444396_105128 [Flavobacterium segetis]